jgi:hypothetical protein
MREWNGTKILTTMSKPRYNLTELVRETAVFDFFRDGQLWYRIISNLSDSEPTFFQPEPPVELFRFAVPVNDTGTGTFKAVDKAIYFMRWIRPAVEAANAELSLNVEPIA